MNTTPASAVTMVVAMVRGEPWNSNDGAYTNMYGTMNATKPSRTAVKATDMGLERARNEAVNAARATGGVIADRQAK